MCTGVCVCARAHVCVHVLRLVSTDMMLRFINTFILIIIITGRDFVCVFSCTSTKVQCR